MYPPPAQDGIYQTPAMTGVPVAQAPPVPHTAPVPFHVGHTQLPQGPWTTGLYDCDCNDDECCITCFCPCITFGRIAEILDKGSISSCGSAALYALVCVTGFLPLYSCFYRYKLRQEYRLREEPCADCCVHCWCECCALCQMYRELKRRGLDMTIGWYANMDRRMPPPAPTAPPVYEDMKR